MEQLLDEIISIIGIHDTFLNETKQERLEVCKSLGILRVSLVGVNWHVPVENLNGGRNRFIQERN